MVYISSLSISNTALGDDFIAADDKKLTDESKTSPFSFCISQHGLFQRDSVSPTTHLYFTKITQLAKLQDQKFLSSRMNSASLLLNLITLVANSQRSRMRTQKSRSLRTKLLTCQKNYLPRKMNSILPQRTSQRYALRMTLSEER